MEDREMKDKLNYKLLNILIIVAIVCLLYSISSLWIGIVSNIFKIIAPFALAFALAYVIYPLVKKLIDAGSPKWLAILTVCILGVGSLLVIIILTVPLLYEQILLFLSNISVFLSDLSTKYEISFCIKCLSNCQGVSILFCFSIHSSCLATPLAWISFRARDQT